MATTVTHATSVSGHQPLAAMPVSVAAVAFHRAFAWPLAPLPRPLCGEAGDAGCCLTFRELADRDLVADVLERFAPEYPGGDRHVGRKRGSESA